MKLACVFVAVGAIALAFAACGCRKLGSWTEVGRRSLPTALESFAHEFERLLVVAVSGVEAAAQVAVEFVDVGVAEAAGPVSVPADLERHLVHDAEEVHAGGLCDPEFAGFEAAERIDR